MLAVVKEAVRPVYRLLFPRTVKRRTELAYWKWRHDQENGHLRNDHYERLYTEVYELQRKDYSGKRVLDIGCRPRGSLEWADMTTQRVGLDPLVPEYLKLGASEHKMEYIASGSENIPVEDQYFDIIACLNALDHVDHLDPTIREIKRVTKRGGLFLLSVEIDHPPTPAEPITINEAALKTLAPEFEVVIAFKVGTPPDHDLHRAVITRSPLYVTGQPGVCVARYHRR